MSRHPHAQGAVAIAVIVGLVYLVIWLWAKITEAKGEKA